MCLGTFSRWFHYFFLCLLPPVSPNILIGTSEIDQLYKICSILGTPGRTDWQEGFTLANAMSFRFPTFAPTHLSQVLGARSSARSVSFLYTLLTWNPGWRSSAQEALKHAYFRGPKGSAAAAAAAAATDAAMAADKMEGSEVAGSALAIAQRRNNNNNNVDSEDYEKLRESLRHKKQVNASKSLDDISGQQQQQQQQQRQQQHQITNSHSQQNLDRGSEEDLSDLISAFGLSPDASRRRQQQLQQLQRQIDGGPTRRSAVANPPTFERATAAAGRRGRLVSRESSLEENGRGGNTLKDKMPKFSNLDPSDRGQHQLQRQRIRAQQQLQQHQLLQRNSSLEEELEPQASAIATSMSKLSNLGTTKFATLYRQQQLQQQQPASVDGVGVGINSGLVNGAATSVVPVYASAARDPYVPSFDLPKARGGGVNAGLSKPFSTSVAQRRVNNPPNGIIANGLHHNSSSSSHLSRDSPTKEKAVTFSTNRALAATSPLYSDKFAPSFRSVQDFSGTQEKRNGIPHSTSFTLVGNGHAKAYERSQQPQQQQQQQQQQQHKQKPTVHVRTNWAAKYLK